MPKRVGAYHATQFGKRAGFGLARLTMKIPSNCAGVQ